MLWGYTWRVARSTPNIYLIGPTGSGKTAVGRQLARDLGLEFRDADREIEKRTGVEISYIFEKEGEAGFREREREMIDELAELEGAVIATGGGAVLNDANRARLAASGIVVYLKTGINEQLKRTGRTGKRPLLNNGNPREILERMAAVRGPLYEEIANLSVDTSHQRVRSVAKNLKEILEQRDDLPHSTRPKRR